MDEQKCSYCGCKFKVNIPLSDGHNEREEYSCPECGKEYRARACMTPRVTLLTPRTDGRTDSYKE